MKYCADCHTIHEESCSVCPDCQNTLRAPEKTDWVLLAVDKEYEINALCSALSAQDIPFQTETKNVSAGSLSSRGFRGDSSVQVPFANYVQGRSTAKQLGFHFPEDAIVTPLEETGKKNKRSGGTYSAVAGQKNPTPEDDTPAGKKRIGKVLLWASVIGVLVAGIAVTEIIINVIKGMF